MSQPPPLPDQPLSTTSAAANPVIAPPDARPYISGAGIPGTEGMTDEQIAREVYDGGRFVLYPWCVSVVILTFRQSSRVRFLRAGQDGFGAALGYSLISLLFGWWGFPWGLIRTPGCLFHCSRGGKDVTRDVLGHYPGGRNAVAALNGAPKRSVTWRMRLLPFVILGIPLFLVAGPMLGLIGAASMPHTPPDPKYAKFEAANHFVASASNGIAGGNTPEARKAADEIAAQMKAMRDELFTKTTKSSSISLTHGNFLTWCEIQSPDKIVVLMHVPDLRKYRDDAKSEMADLAWAVSAASARKLVADPTKPFELTVATRGAVLYDRTVTGKVYPVTNDEKARQPRPQTVASGSGAEEAVRKLFVPVTLPAAQP